MLFEMVTGKRTFEGKTQASIVGQILAVDPPSVSTLRPQTPPGLDRVIRLCLDKDPDERIQTAHDLKLQLQAIAEAPAAMTEALVVVPCLLYTSDVYKRQTDQRSRQTLSARYHRAV